MRHRPLQYFPQLWLAEWYSQEECRPKSVTSGKAARPSSSTPLTSIPHIPCQSWKRQPPLCGLCCKLYCCSCSPARDTSPSHGPHSCSQRPACWPQWPSAHRYRGFRHMHCRRGTRHRPANQDIPSPGYPSSSWHRLRHGVLSCPPLWNTAIRPYSRQPSRFPRCTLSPERGPGRRKRGLQGR